MQALRRISDSKNRGTIFLLERSHGLVQQVPSSVLKSFYLSVLEEWRRIKLGNFSTIPDSSNQGGVVWVLANTLNEAITEAADGVTDGEKKFVTRTGKLGSQSVHSGAVLSGCDERGLPEMSEE